MPTGKKISIFPSGIKPSAFNHSTNFQTYFLRSNSHKVTFEFCFSRKIIQGRTTTGPDIRPRILSSPFFRRLKFRAAAYQLPIQGDHCAESEKNFRRRGKDQAYLRQ